MARQRPEIPKELMCTYDYGNMTKKLYAEWLIVANKRRDWMYNKEQYDMFDLECEMRDVATDLALAVLEDE